jgi:hypothetical protein
MRLLSKTQNKMTAFLSDKMTKLLSHAMNIVMGRNYKCARNILFLEEHDVNKALTVELVCIKTRETHYLRGRIGSTR